MEPRTIQGLTKVEFLNKCIEKADEINPNWERDIFQVDNLVPSVIWTSIGEVSGFSLSTVGEKFFEQALQLTPYYLETKFLYSGDIVALCKVMPWPYTARRFDGSLVTRIGIYSSEVAVWAALYDNDLDQLLEAYSRK